MQLVQLRAVDSDNHPDVVALHREDRGPRKGLRREPPASDAKTQARRPMDRAPTICVSPISTQQLEAAEDAARGDSRRRPAALDASIQKTPQIEIALNVLMRDYDGLQGQYSAAKAKLAEAATGEQLEQDRQAERFEVVEQATAPSSPSAPTANASSSPALFGGVAARCWPDAAPGDARQEHSRHLRPRAPAEDSADRRDPVTSPSPTRHGQRKRLLWRRLSLLARSLLSSP